MLSRTIKHALLASSIIQGGGKRRAEGLEWALRCAAKKKEPQAEKPLGVPRSVPQLGLLRAAGVSGDGALPGRPNGMN